MSIEIYAFLGPNVDELERRFLDAFESIGFKVGLHPDMDLLHSNPTGCMNVAIFETPTTLKRLAPGQPLLTSFEYSVARRDHLVDENDWPPKGVKNHSYELYTRTSAGRSRASCFMQAFTAAILAKETEGFIWFSGDTKALSGRTALKRVLGELKGLDKSVTQLRELMETLEKKHGVVEANCFGRAVHNCLDDAFDIGAFPFQRWPTIENYSGFIWSAPICLPPFEAKRGPWWSSVSLYWAAVVFVVMLLVSLTVIYS